MINKTIHIIVNSKSWRFLKKITLVSLCGLLCVFLLAVGLVFFYEKEAKALLVNELNKHLNAEVKINTNDINLTIIKTFPNCALEFKNITILEAIKNKHKDTLVSAKQLLLEFSIKDLYYKHYNIIKIEVNNAKANLRVDAQGNANYIIWKNNKNNATENDSLSFKLNQIKLNNIEFNYKNKKQKINIKTTVNELNFNGNFATNNYDLHTDGNAFVTLIQIEKVHYLRQKKIDFKVTLSVNQNTYTIKKAQTSINKTIITSNGNFVFNDSLRYLNLAFTGKNLDVSSTISILPQSFQKHLNDYESEGEFYASGNCNYNIRKPIALNLEFGIKKATITYKQTKTSLSNVNLVGKLILKDKKSELQLHNISANLNSNAIKGDVTIVDFNNPYLKLNVDANLKLNELLNFYPIDTLENLSGNLVLNANIEGLVNDMKTAAFSASIKASGNATINNIKLKFKQSEKEINIPQGNLILENRNLKINELSVINGQSDVTINGNMPNFLEYLLDTSTPFILNATLISNNLQLEDFIYKTNTTTNVNINDNLDYNINATIKQFTFGKFIANNINGFLLIKNKKIALKDMALQTADGNINLNAFADASNENIVINGNVEIEKLNIKKMFYQLNNFGQQTITDANLNGIITANANFSATWDKQLNCNLNSINVTSTVVIDRGELNNFKPLESLGKYIDVNELKNIKFSTLQSTIDIKNKLITLPKTVIKSSALNIELFGTHTFDNIVDYHIQLLISDLLAKRFRQNKQLNEELALLENDPENKRSVFVLMKGPVDNLIIKYDSKGAKQKIKDDIKTEKQTIKQLLKEEFGFFKKDSIKIKSTEKANQKFKVEFGDAPKKTSTPEKNKNEIDDDF